MVGLKKTTKQQQRKNQECAGKPLAPPVASQVLKNKKIKIKKKVEPAVKGGPPVPSREAH